jgi:hypothetical protein
MIACEAPSGTPENSFLSEKQKIKCLKVATKASRQNKDGVRLKYVVNLAAKALKVHEGDVKLLRRQVKKVIRSSGRLLVQNGVVTIST